MRHTSTIPVRAGIWGAVRARVLELFTFALALGLCTLTAGTARALPPERHYEMVSPVYKGGYGASRVQESTAAMGRPWEGERFVFHSLGTFDGAPNNTLFSSYVAQRSSSGWQTSPLLVPSSISANGGAVFAFQPGLESALFEFSNPSYSTGEGEALQREPELLAHSLSLPDTAPNAPEPGPNFEVAGFPLQRIDGKPLFKHSVEGVSSNLCRVVFRTGVGSAEGEPLLRDAIAGGEIQKEPDLYEMATGSPGCDGQRWLRLLGSRNVISPGEESASISAHCATVLGGGLGTVEASGFNAISADGSEVFFTIKIGSVKAPEECNKGSYPDVLYVRLGGERTLQVSIADGASCEVGTLCPGQRPAEFVGANETGSRAFFMTKQALLPGVTDTSQKLYMANIGCPEGDPACAPAEREVTSRVLVSKVLNAGEAAEVQGAVLAVAPDGGKVYFVARGVLGEEGPVGEGVQAKPLRGAENLYVYDAEEGSAGSVRFIADLCSGPDISGEAVDQSCPGSLSTEVGSRENDTTLWDNDAQAQTAGQNGQFLAFTTYARLTPDDTDTARDVYRYDAQTGQLVRASLGEDGENANGNDDSFNAEIPVPNRSALPQEEQEMGDRAIGEDGSRIVFETADQLSPAAENHLVNAYEWHEGHVSLVSSGSDEESVGLGANGLPGDIAITPSGRDIFFLTPQKLVAQDVDSAVDVYDARLGPDFPEPLAVLTQCKGDACQGPLTNPAPLLIPGSLSQPSGENVAVLAKAVTVKTKPKKKARAKKKHRVKRRRKVHRATSGVGRGRGK